MTIRDRSGVTLFTHDARTGESRVEARGDLLLAAPRANVDLESAGRVRVRAERIELSTPPQPAREAGASIHLGRGGAALEAAELRVSAQRGAVALADATFAADRVETATRKARHIAGVVETRAERLVERARNAFREVDELS